MSMTREQMQAGLQRLFIIQYFKDEEKAAYGEVIYEACAWMDSYRFDTVVKEVLKTLKTNQRLKPAHFLAAYRQLAEQNGWHRAESKACASCGGVNFVYCWVRDKKGYEFRATKGCPECNAKYSHAHPDFTEIPTPDDAPIDTRDNVRKTPSFMAQCLLGIADSARLKVKPELLDDLMQAAAQPGLTKYYPGKYDQEKRKYQMFNESQRKNEIVTALLKAPPAVEEPPPTSPPAEEPIAVEAKPFQPEPEGTVFEPEEGVPPAVAHIPKERRDELARQAEEEGVPF